MVAVHAYSSAPAGEKPHMSAAAGWAPSDDAAADDTGSSGRFYNYCRYSKFERLRERLLDELPLRAMVPDLPRKTLSIHGASEALAAPPICV